MPSASAPLNCSALTSRSIRMSMRFGPGEAMASWALETFFGRYRPIESTSKIPRLRMPEPLSVSSSAPADRVANAIPASRRNLKTIGMAALPSLEQNRGGDQTGEGDGLQHHQEHRPHSHDRELLQRGLHADRGDRRHQAPAR